MHKLAFCIFTAALWLGTLGAAQAASGTALGVDPGANATNQSETRVLVVGADLFIGERVITDANGLVQIKFTDSTELVVGPNSSLLLEDYLLREDGSVGKLAINALAGTFRFVTGTAPKDKYLITTPTGTIGVRGTAVDFNVTDLLTSVLVIHGSVVLCNLAKQCVIIDDTCEVGQYDLSTSEVLGHADLFNGAEREAMRSMFPYSVSEADLLRQFREAQARRCMNRPFVNDAPKSIVDHNTGGEDCPIYGKGSDCEER